MLTGFKEFFETSTDPAADIETAKIPARDVVNSIFLRKKNKSPEALGLHPNSLAWQIQNIFNNRHIINAKAKS